MSISRRRTLQSLGVLTATTATAGTVVAGNHENDEADDNDEEPDDVTADETEPGPVGATAVRVGHFAPDAPDVDIYVDDELVLADVPFDAVSPYLELEPGTYAIRITAAGDPDAVVYDDEMTLGNAFYTIAAIGELELDTFRPIVLVDAGSALIRLAHVAPDAPAVDIVTSDGELVLFENVDFGESSDYLPMPAGNFSLDIFPSAAVDDDVDEDAVEDEEVDADEDDYEDEETGADDENEVEDENDYDDEDEENDYEDDDYDEEDEDEVEDENDDEDDEDLHDDAFAEDRDIADHDEGPVATVEVTLETETEYTAFATGYLEPPEEFEDRSFAVNLVEDGPIDEPEEDEPEADPDDENDLEDENEPTTDSLKATL